MVLFQCVLLLQRLLGKLEAHGGAVVAVAATVVMVVSTRWRSGRAVFEEETGWCGFW